MFPGKLIGGKKVENLKRKLVAKEEEKVGRRKVKLVL